MLLVIRCVREGYSRTALRVTDVCSRGIAVSIRDLDLMARSVRGELVP